MSWFSVLSWKAKATIFVSAFLILSALSPSSKITPPEPEPEPDKVAVVFEGSDEESAETLGEADETEQRDEEPAPVPAPVPEPEPEPAPAPVPEPAPVSSCEPSYPDVCIPIGSTDYDCAGGSGNGPNYIQGPVRVLWSVSNPDPHGLDRDRDGWGCEK